MKFDSKSWKDSLLKSSLPLEYLSADILRKNHFYISGDYVYNRKNENGVDTEFSIDLSAFHFIEKKKDKPWGNLNILVECKYAHQSSKWVFMPNLQEDRFIGSINVFQDLTHSFVDTDNLYKIDKSLDYCLKGIELYSNEFNPHNISKGLNQLRYASTNLALNTIRTQSISVHDEDLYIDFFVPILVTTADLFVIKDKLKFDNFYSAEDISDVSKKVDALVVYQEASPSIHNYINNETQYLKYIRDINERLQELNPLRPKETNEYFFNKDIDWIQRLIFSSAEHIIVVNYNSLDKYLKLIIRLVKSTQKSLRKFAQYNFDRKNYRLSIVACKNKTQN